MLMGAAFVFTEGKYNGSTVVVLGRNPIGEQYRELPIIGGTGVFRLARGVVTLQTYFFNFTMALAIVEMDSFQLPIVYCVIICWLKLKLKFEGLPGNLMLSQVTASTQFRFPLPRITSMIGLVAIDE
ncbi:Dirigent protein 19 [Sesamum angolense]|uniref:Dirigent protein n=1 Tax=Sesamum angolense TaxID=2727404 RepID=A0AAE2C6R4_9LAMI|nr:Dirigent protein 19 [Sesamum angolense]